MELSLDTVIIVGAFVTMSLGIASFINTGFKEVRKDMHSMETGLKEDIHKLDKKVDGLEIKVNNLDENVNKLDKKVDKLEAKVDGLEIKVNDLDKKFVQLDTKVTHMEGMLHNHVNGHSHPPRGGMQS